MKNCWDDKSSLHDHVKLEKNKILVFFEKFGADLLFRITLN